MNACVGTERTFEDRQTYHISKFGARTKGQLSGRPAFSVRSGLQSVEVGAAAASASGRFALVLSFHFIPSSAWTTDLD